MENKYQNLWPALGDNDLTTPANILKEQGRLLSDQTKNLLAGQVEMGTHPIEEFPHQGFTQKFFVVAPFVSGYRFLLLQVHHGMELYPLVVETTILEDRLECKDEKEFLDTLELIFNHQRTVNTMKSLLAQSK